MDFWSRRKLGYAIEADFEKLCKSYKYQIIDSAFEKTHEKVWEYNMTKPDAQRFWESGYNCDCKEEDIEKFKEWLQKNNDGNTPAYQRYGPDRILAYLDKWAGEKKCGFSIKSKVKDSHKFYMIEAMDVFAHGENVDYYGCEIYYTFPPDNYSNEWRFCSAPELLQVAEYIEPPLTWKGSKKPCYKIACKLIYKPLWILFETNFSHYAGSI
jgi:hypothetical protein